MMNYLHFVTAVYVPKEATKNFSGLITKLLVLILRRGFYRNATLLIKHFKNHAKHHRWETPRARNTIRGQTIVVFGFLFRDDFTVITPLSLIPRKQNGDILATL